MIKPPSIPEFERSLAEIDRMIEQLDAAAKERGDDEAARKAQDLRMRRNELLKSRFDQLSPWNEVELARHPKRPYSLDYVRILFDDFCELHGDRLAGDDQAIIGGPARFRGRPVMLILQQKGRDVKERSLRNFGYATPGGYRKALRLMKLAEKVGLPVLTLVDTPGADPKISSEETGISDAIARNLMEMSRLRTVILSAVIGEGGSGGAIGMAVADTVLILEHAIYSVIAPEGCAAIMAIFGRDPNRKAEAAEALKLTAGDALRLGVVDDIVAEPLGGAHENVEAAAQALGASLECNLSRLCDIDTEALVARRYAKFRQMGQYEVVGAEG